MTTAIVQQRPAAVRLGLRDNAAQCGLLVVVNAFVGAMLGMERIILPSIAEQDRSPRSVMRYAAGGMIGP